MLYTNTKIMKHWFNYTALAIFAGLSFSCSDIEEANDKVPQSQTLAASAASSVGDVVGKITVGYQGWFSAKGDGSPVNDWGHGNLENWPDVREYTTTYQTPFGNLGNGEPATLFSSYDQQVLNKHFSWMAQYGIDCAALQRFTNEIDPGSVLKRQRDGVATMMRNAAEANNRKFYIMYDLSGGVATPTTDWTNTIVNSLHLTSSSAYARQNGKPVVCLWGIGYIWLPLTAQQAIDMINFYKSQGCYVIGGVPGSWRSKDGYARADYDEVYKNLDMIMPWAVGGFTDINYPLWVQDNQNYCNSIGVDFQADAYPGFSFNNSQSQSTRNEIPRSHGDFMWTQFATMRAAGVSSVYISMFDEMNEGTAIFKLAEDASMVPAGRWYLTLDADGVHTSSDFYLRLVNDAQKMIKGITPYQPTCPTTFIEGIPNPDGVIFFENTGFNGAASGKFTPGNYTLYDLRTRGFVNDWASSVKIPSGMTLTVYSDDNFSGQSWTLKADQSNLAALRPSADNTVSSFKIQ